jgi:hypothetical protein
MIKVTVSNCKLIFEGQQVTISGLRDPLPDWCFRRPWQDGDIALFRWFGNLAGIWPDLNGVWTIAYANGCEMDVAQ